MINAEESSTIEPVPLLPLEVMSRPLELRFRYHFDGDRPTNRADKVGTRINFPFCSESDYCSLNISCPT